jgi:hypothetical protein
MRWVGLLAFLSLSASSAVASAQELSRATIHFFDWHTAVIVALRVDDVRIGYHTRIEITDSVEATRFGRWIRERKFEPSPESKTIDVRLVIDLYDTKGGWQTFFADKLRIYAEGGATSAPIDEAFREKFRISR